MSQPITSEPTAPSFATDPETALACYRRDGYYVDTGLFSPDECATLIAAGSELAGTRAGSSRPAMNPHRDDARFLNAMADRRLVRVVELLCGGPVSGLQSEFFYCRPGTPGFAPHQDNFFVEAPDDSFTSAWLALVDVGPDNGGLVLFPGSHRAGRMTTERLSGAPSPYQDPNAATERAVVPPEYRPVDVVLPQGSVIFIHGWVAHASHDNTSERWRYALLNTYLRRGAPFRPGNYAGRAEVVLAGTSAP